MNSNNDNKNTAPNNWGYKAGQIIGIVLTACLVAIIMALTVKLIIWMF